MRGWRFRPVITGVLEPRCDAWAHSAASRRAGRCGRLWQRFPALPGHAARGRRKDLADTQNRISHITLRLINIPDGIPLSHGAMTAERRTNNGRYESESLL